jgi:hypothetical protein
LLLTVLLSVVLELTFTLLVYVPVERGFMTMVTLALAPLAILPRVQATVVEPLQLP